MNSPIESTVLRAFPWLIAGLLVALPLLLIPASSDRRWDLLIHLSALALFSLALTWRLAATDTNEGFAGHTWSVGRRWMTATVCLIVVVTGATALVTLATTAALRFQPSLQFLQLLSALDIAWVVSGITLAVRHLLGRSSAVAAGVAMSIVCVMSIALYLAEVGLTSDGGWLVDGKQMMRLVLPFDTVAGFITISLLVLATRSSSDRAGKTPVVG